MVAPLGQRPQPGELNPSTLNGWGGSAGADTRSPSSHTSFIAFLGEAGATDFGDLMTPVDLFEYRLTRNESTAPSIDLVAEPEPVTDAATEAELAAHIAGNIRQSMKSDAVQPVVEKPDQVIGGTFASTLASADVVEGPKPEPVAEVSTTKPRMTGYAFRQKDLAHQGDPIVDRTEADKTAAEIEDPEPEVLIATEVLTDPGEVYEPISKKRKEHVRAVSFSAKTLIKGILGKIPGLNIIRKSRNIPKRKMATLGLAAVVSLVAANGLASTRGSGENPLSCGPQESATDVAIAAGAWSEKIPTVMRWESDVIRLIKEYDQEAAETNERNRREGRPGIMPCGAVDSGLILATMVPASGGNPFAVDKNADPSNPDKIPAGLLGINREVGRQLVLDYEPTNYIHSMKAGIALWQVLLSRVPETDAADRPSLLSAALQGKRSNQPNMPYPVSPQLLAEMVAAVPAIDSAWHLPENPHLETLLQNPAAKERLQLAVNEAKDSPLVTNTTTTQPNKKK